MSDPTKIVRRTATWMIYQGDSLVKIQDANDQYEVALTAMRDADEEYDRALETYELEREEQGDGPSGPPKRVGEKATKTEARKRLDAAKATQAKARSAAERRATELDAVMEAAKETGLKLVIQAFPRRKWRELKGKHLPRKDNEIDEAIGVNQDTLWNDIEGLTGAVIQPEFTPESWLEFAEELGDGDWQNISQVIWEINERPTAIPNFSAASDYRRRTESGLK